MTRTFRLILGAAIVAVLPVGALLLVPIHYLVTGYLTSWGNIFAEWIFAFLANIPAFAITAHFWCERKAQEAQKA